MNICVIATASRASGALSIYRQFLEAIKTDVGGDRYCIFVDPTMPQPSIPGVEYVTCNTCGLRRIKFDMFGFRNRLKVVGFAPDVIVSLQNVPVNCRNVRQIVYFHTIVPLVDDTWNPLFKDERTLFFYRSLYPHYVAHFLKPGMRIVVQANFIKELFVKKFRFNPADVYVLHPDIVLPNNGTAVTFKYEADTCNFIYPANYLKYKNHDLLVRAAGTLRRLNPKVYGRLRIHLTVYREDAAPLIRKMSYLGSESAFVFHGPLEHSALMGMLASSNGLLFPSELETLGLPLLEAASLGVPIVVSDLAYAHEALGNYGGAAYASCCDPQTWASEIISLCSTHLKYKPYRNSGESSWTQLFKLIRDEC